MTTCGFSARDYMSSLIFRLDDIGNVPLQDNQSLLIIGLYVLISLVIDGEIHFLRTQLICNISKYIWLVFCRYLMDFEDLRSITRSFILFTLYCPSKIAKIWSFIFMLIDGKTIWNFDYGFSDSRFTHPRVLLKSDRFHFSRRLHWNDFSDISKHK